MGKNVGHRCQAFADLHLDNPREFEASVATVDESKPNSTPVLTFGGSFLNILEKHWTTGKALKIID